MMPLSCWLFLGLLLRLAGGQPSVTVSQGTLVGQQVNSTYGTYYTFLGIPYAKPPLGDLRFKAPLAADPWNGTLHAVQEGNTCKQESNKLHTGELITDEDCLFINVYTPQPPSSGELLPVLVWIHGGGWQSGSGNFEQQGPEFLLSHGVVYASFNYRLGVFGFLSTEDDAVPGNAGMKDQVLALHWIQDNIAAFGGDPDKVTIFGESAGGASVHYHMVSPMSQGLFWSAIAESGSVANPPALKLKAKNTAFQIGSALGYSGNSSQELVQLLRAVDADSLLEASNTVQVEGIRFAPAVEPFLEGETPFLPHHPIQLLEQGKFQNVPYITGTNSNEGLLNAYDQGFIDGGASFQELDENFVQTFKPSLRFCKEQPCGDEMMKQVRNFYFGSQPLSNASLMNLTELYTDMLYTEGTVYGVQQMASRNTAPVYLYQFSYDGGLGSTKHRFPILHNYSGVPHADELGYIFDTGVAAAEGSTDANVRKAMVTMWTNFAKFRNPTPEVTEGIPQWLPYSNSTTYYMDVDEQLLLSSGLHGARIEFWENLYSSYTEN